MSARSVLRGRLAVVVFLMELDEELEEELDEEPDEELDEEVDEELDEEVDEELDEELNGLAGCDVAVSVTSSNSLPYLDAAVAT